ncbi:unnamed protein product [Blepharisma stoltei]|uniref:V-SNARE coiled-coil homology domain-containing protein n=1 Tax=Blepharisma stoltei TaxID=1481888 RepID=A0AAU9K1G7_9CILI|nr:unnamed protein product [Blepharisma stoltei]
MDSPFFSDMLKYSNNQAKIIEELLKNDDQSMKSQLTKALEASLQREGELKNQCDQLLETLKNLIPEETREKQTPIRPKYSKSSPSRSVKSPSPSRKLANEFLGTSESEILYSRLVSGDLENGSKLWKKLGYEKFSTTDFENNYLILQEVVKQRDIKIAKLEADLRIKNKQKNNSEILAELEQKDNEIELLKNTLLSKDNGDGNILEKYEQDVLEKETEIRELLLEYEKLQISFDNLRMEKMQTDNEIISLREKVAQKSHELRTVYEPLAVDDKESLFRSSGLKFNPDQEFEPIKQAYSEAVAYASYLESQLKILKRSKSDIFDLKNEIENIFKGKSLNDEETDRVYSKINEILQSKIIEQIDSINPSIVQSMKLNVEKIESEKLNKEAEIIVLNSEINRLKSFLEVENAIELDIKQKIKDKSSIEQWKKIKREHVNRVEKVYKTEIEELQSFIKQLQEEISGYLKDITNLKEKHGNDVQDLTNKLKREHDTKKQLAELFAKEKFSHEKSKEMLSSKVSFDTEKLAAQLKDAQNALESSNKKIFQLEKEIESNIKIIQNHEKLEIDLNNKIAEVENSKQKLYTELTRLNKKIQEIELEKNKEIQNLKDEVTEYEDVMNKNKQEILEKNEKMAELERENNTMQREIYDQDYRIKTKDNVEEKIKKYQREIKELKEQAKINEAELQDKKRMESDVKILQNNIKLYEESTKQLKQEIKRISADLQDAQNDLVASKRIQESELQRKSLNEQFQMSEASKFKDLQNRYMSLSQEFSALKRQLAEAMEERNSLYAQITDLIQQSKTISQKNSELEENLDEKNKENGKISKKCEKEVKGLMDEINNKEKIIHSLQIKIQKIEKQNEDSRIIEKLNEKVEEIEKKYDQAEESQRKMLEDVKMKYIDWCKFTSSTAIQRISPSQYRSSDPVKETSKFIDAFYNEAKTLFSQDFRSPPIEAQDQPLSVSPSDFTSFIDYTQETNQDFIEKANILLSRLEVLPENKAKAQAIKLLQENISLKQELLDRQNKGAKDEETFKKLKDIKGINDWALQKWQDSERDVIRLRAQLLEATKDLENKIHEQNEFNKVLDKAKEKIEKLEKSLKNMKDKEGGDLSSETDTLRRTLRELTREKNELNKSLQQEWLKWKSSLIDLLEKISLVIPIKKDASIDENSPDSIAQAILSSINAYKNDHTTGAKVWPEKEEEYLNSIHSFVVEKKGMLKSLDESEKEIIMLKKQIESLKISMKGLQDENSLLKDRLKKAEESGNSKEKALNDSYQRGIQYGISEGRQIERNELEAENKHLQALIKEYKESKEMLQNKLQDQYHRIDEDRSYLDQDEIIKAFYEEKDLREDLERELNQKCDLIESLLKDLESKRRYMQNREYEYQELLTLKDEELLRLRYQLAQDISGKKSDKSLDI